jgi:8-amino-7-oxononanoate synthase
MQRGTITVMMNHSRAVPSAVDAGARVNLATNDYLGLADHPRLREAVAEAAMTDGVGSTGSRRLSGDHPVFADAEAMIAQWVGMEAGLLFNSGYQMNVGLFSAMSDARTLIVADKYSHASIVDGIRLSAARLMRFRHNDADHCAHLLAKHATAYTRCIIVCESIYSMDGDEAPIADLIRLKQQYGAQLMVDEAHSMGLYGRGGNGWVNHHGVLSGVDAIMMPLGKAFGLSGAMLVGSAALIATMKRQCRSYIYSTAPMIPLGVAIQRSCELIQGADAERARIRSHIARIRQGLQSRSTTHIQPLVVGEAAGASAAEEALWHAGFWIKAVHHPTVPKGQSRLRLTLSARHTAADIDRAMGVLRPFHCKGCERDGS